MTKLYFCRTSELQEKLKSVLSAQIGGGYEIKRTDNGKPYIEGNPVFFSISHSGDDGVILICDAPCGVDLEVLKDRKFDSYYKRLSARERAEIDGNLKVFLTNWVAKEAYIKYIGGTLAHDLKRLEYFDGTLFCGGKKADCEIRISNFDSAVCAVCTGEKI
ncbi:MAG: 4'-phosphopantetheinyl transferase superfamily protein [Clostridia bacterium]|nr:4'-phosphopantetheinyl transferase superfamily protein [Clostridia bacterium]